MWHVGIDLHRATVVLAAVSDVGEACGTYRWLYDLLRPHGTVLLAHPMRLRAMIQRRTKTDKLDAQLLANLLRINQIPLAYIRALPPAFINPAATATKAPSRARVLRGCDGFLPKPP